MRDALLVDFNDGGLGARVVEAEHFDELAFLLRTGFRDHDTEERTLLGTGTAETNRQHLDSLAAQRGRAYLLLPTTDVRRSRTLPGPAKAGLYPVRLKPDSTRSG